ncbi:unnamed protein product [Rotaria socialis]|uniref:Uncharacterized protein n=2 Tax=Rotaria socialis TaxID=392032 RepID=A0A820UUX5_9BILA|nr:unnamed protein product [Rotaria socialis]CAF3536250.1 unnamed protein product [Rotaria socialis]CAF4491115.1 unnamed protein product [Rotaria socialis]
METSMEQRCIHWLTYVLQNWSNIDVRTVPGVMYQVLCGSDEGIQYRFHWFWDCEETYIHNHRYAFDTYCIEGEYVERIWEIVPDDTDAVTYYFSRESGNHLTSLMNVCGTLRIVECHSHFPGNVLHVRTDQFHSISPMNGLNNRVMTFVARILDSSMKANTHILSSTATIEAPIETILVATPEERLAMYCKLQQISMNYNVS